MDSYDQTKQALVIGGSMAGLLTARILSDYFEQVTILERDPVHNHPESRKGQPHTRHLHGILANGMAIFTKYFPDLRDEMSTYDILLGDMGENMNWYTHGGYRLRVKLGLESATLSRPLLEHLIRKRVLALPNVDLQDNCAVKNLLATDDNKRVIGVTAEQRNQEKQTVTLNANLIVDCAGRGSRAPQWLEALGYGAVPESEVKVDVGYATRLYRRDPDDPLGGKWTFVTPDAVTEMHFAGMFPIEDGRWILTMGGFGGDYCPATEEGFLEFARNLSAPDIYNTISQAEPLSDIISHKMRSSLRRHYEKMKRFPAGYLVLGDSICSFNPTYGQGMTAAAMQVQALDDLLAKRPLSADLAPSFFKRASKVVDNPWQIAVGEDFRYATTTGNKPPGTDLINKYVSKVNRVSIHDEVVCAAFLQVMNLQAPPTSLFHPKIMKRVMWPQKTVNNKESVKAASVSLR